MRIKNKLNVSLFRIIVLEHTFIKTLFIFLQISLRFFTLTIHVFHNTTLQHPDNCKSNRIVKTCAVREEPSAVVPTTATFDLKKRTYSSFSFVIGYVESLTRESVSSKI